MTPEMRKLIGDRVKDDDGFTYVHGRVKGGRKKRTRNRLATIRCIRLDKRAVRKLELARMFSEQGYDPVTKEIVCD